MDYIPFPNISPELFSFELFGLTIALRWYALAYMAGLLLGWVLIRHLMRRPHLWPRDTAPMSRTDVDDLLTFMIVGVIVGGRLGFTLFYQPAYYLANPAEIWMVWQGGMSFHGGFLGVIAGICLFAWTRKCALLSVGDAVALAAPIGIFFGRVANFINAELWGLPTKQPWGVVFPGPRAQDCPWEGPCARHPSQLYEAGLEGVLLFFAMLWLLRNGALKTPGRLIGVFLLGYGVARMFVEIFRQADSHYISETNPFGYIIDLGFAGLTMGQILSLPMVIIGVAVLFWPRRRA